MTDRATSHEDYLEVLRREAAAGDQWAQDALEFWTRFNADRKRTGEDR